MVYGWSRPRNNLAPRDTPRDTLARDTLARDTLARDTLARDTLARDTLARDTLARDTLASRLTCSGISLTSTKPTGSCFFDLDGTHRRFLPSLLAQFCCSQGIRHECKVKTLTSCYSMT